MLPGSMVFLPAWSSAGESLWPKAVRRRSRPTIGWCPVPKSAHWRAMSVVTGDIHLSPHCTNASGGQLMISHAEADADILVTDLPHEDLEFADDEFEFEQV